MSKKVIFRTACAIAVITLAGCKIELSSSVPLSALLGQEIKTGSAELYVEVPSCNDYEDSRKPSKSLIEAKEEISQIFTDSEFKECFKKKLDSIALFSVPIAYGPDGKVAKDTPQLRVLFNEKNYVYFDLGSGLKSRINNAKNKPSISGGFSPSDVSLFVNLVNDTGKDIKADYVSTYIAGTPIIHAAEVNLPNAKNMVLKLSDVTTAVMFDASENNRAWFMSNINN
ncbi:Hypothetical protein AKI40_1209 [Enterobacter sp. FY-07]|uniref:DUF7424 family protein n=1 Tax=Kosakonia oryzendophytica TaxID=1005665 RepID=UPI0007776CDB|nr:hypothetical protein [Kosakonia oryzendophytica]AMO47626.1 Hypothetical protein AKI40_1209 [Enterobacter sp. FY-07]WBT59333.1 hypothetical protein O9K67_05970 [Kosakonia oryzendophytica]